MRSHPKNPRVWRRAIAIGGSVGALAMALVACTTVTKVLDLPAVVIGTGSPSGIYYPLGGSVCRLFNLDTPRDGRRCVTAPSPGPITNIDLLQDGRIDVGIVPSDVLADAVAGQGPFALRAPDKNLGH